MLVKLSAVIILGAVLAFMALGYHWPLALVLIALIPLVIFRAYRVIYVVFILAYVGFCAVAHVSLKQSLPARLDKQTVIISVHLLEFPQYADTQGATKLTVALNDEIKLTSFSLPAGSKIRLSDYAGLNIQPGQDWTVQAVLRSPRGLVNAAGFDYRRWLLSEHILATGYIVESEHNQLRSIRPPSLLSLRYDFAAKLNTVLSDRPSRALIKALVLGDSSAFSLEHRQIFSKTGIAHLFVISGLHIGLIAALGWFVGRCLCILSWHPLHYGYALRIQAACAVFAALSYAALAGLSLPTVRAVVMVALMLLASFYRRYYRPVHVLLIVAAFIIVTEPLVILGLSFWMSFTAVAVLLYAWRSERRWQAMLLAQVSIFLAMNILLSLFDMAIAPLSPLINIVAIPVVSFVLVPFCLMASSLLLLGIETPILMVQTVFDGVWRLLLSLSQLEYSQVALSPALPVLLIAVVGLGIGFRFRQYWYLALLLQLPIYTQLSRESDKLQITIFDVGQGLAVLVRHGGYSLLYDTGAAYPSGFSMAQAVIEPSLYRFGIRSLDALVISHGDNDHAGGAGYIADVFRPENYYAPSSYSGLHTDYKDCAAAPAIQNGLLHIAFLNAALQDASKNNNSCVLNIHYGDFSMLLSGDIEKLGEFTLLNDGLNQTDVITVPHHGSRSSSSEALLNALKPDLAVVSAGFNNRFSHPHKEITARYAEHGIPLLNTAVNGAINIAVGVGGSIESITLARDEKFGFWH